jgi:hypothetical protein
MAGAKSEKFARNVDAIGIGAFSPRRENSEKP